MTEGEPVPAAGPTMSSRAPSEAAGPLDGLPRLRGVQVGLDRRFGPDGPPLVAALLDGWNRLIGGTMVADRFEVQGRAAGLRRPGVVAQLTWVRLRTRVALGIDLPLSHAVVDHLLGFARTEAEARLQVSPVEWGILSFLLAAGLDQLDPLPGPFGPWDLTIDRVGPDPFDLAALGPVVTWRWRVRLGATTGTARLWVPEALLRCWPGDPTGVAGLRDPGRSTRPVPLAPADWQRFGELTSEWHAEIGSTAIPADQLPGSLEPGRLLLLDRAPLTGTIAAPEGKVCLVQSARDSRRWFEARVEPGSAGDRLILTSPLFRLDLSSGASMADPDPLGPNPAALPEATDSTSRPQPDPSDLSVTLVVELGRVHLTLTRLAGLGPGDVVELARHRSDPVDLSSNGRLVARGELVQVDTELGVRITQVFL